MGDASFTTEIRKIDSAVYLLGEIAWMSRRTASTSGVADSARFNEAMWALMQMADVRNYPPLRPDPTALLPTGLDGGLIEGPSCFADGTRADFTPTPARMAQIEAMSEESRVQWLIDVLHPAAHRYADGRMTYATDMFNTSTRGLRLAGFSLAATEALGRSVWASDGMGDSYAGLSRVEADERAAAEHR